MTNAIITATETPGGGKFVFTTVLPNGDAYVFNQTAPDQKTAESQMLSDFSAILTAMQTLINAQ